MPRSAEVAGLIKHFEDPRFEAVRQTGDWSMVPKKDRDHRVAEVLRCQQSFTYAAQNYFWIVNKQRQDQLLTLNFAQELVMDRLAHLKARGRQQKALIVKSRQLGISTLWEALVAWKTMFFINQSGLVLADTEQRSTIIFNMMLHVYNRMPWWLRPQYDKMEYKEGLMFANPDFKKYGGDPGMNSRIAVQAATDKSEIGQGYTISVGHGSEVASWEEDKARKVINGDLLMALVNSQETMFGLETTAKGAGKFIQHLWAANMDMGDRAEWLPIFIPWFFDKTLFMAPEYGWKPEKKELEMRERILQDWLRCDKCQEFFEPNHRLGRYQGCNCGSCQNGQLNAFEIKDDQLCFMWNKRINAEQVDLKEKNKEATKKLKEDLATTAESAFQLAGNAVFPDDCIEYVQLTIRKDQHLVAIGYLDETGKFHGPVDKFGTCYQPDCREKHYLEETPLRIWEWPKKGHQYTLGGDVGGGEGGDYSVAWINRVGIGPHPDVHVATYRSNTILPGGFAGICNYLGRFYNDALVAIENNKFDSCANDVLNKYQYPNVYRWRWEDSINQISSKYHWETNKRSKKRLWTTAITALRQRTWRIQDPQFAYEMQWFQKEANTDEVGAATGYNDDVIIAALIAYYVTHQLDAASNPNSVLIPTDAPPEGNWMMLCAGCGEEWRAKNPQYERCPKCGSLRVGGKPIGSPDAAREAEDGILKRFTGNQPIASGPVLKYDPY